MAPEPLSTSTPVLVVGAGPTGLITALGLAKHGIKCILLDRSETVGDWPKMDLTNRRSMEILKRMGLADEVRAQGMLTGQFSLFNRDSLLNYTDISKVSHYIIH